MLFDCSLLNLQLNDETHVLLRQSDSKFQSKTCGASTETMLSQPCKIHSHLEIKAFSREAAAPMGQAGGFTPSQMLHQILQFGTKQCTTTIYQM